jgi:hypothetical protein
MPQLAAWAFRPLKDPWKRALPLWAVFSAAAFAVGPLVRPMGVPFSTAVSLMVSGVFACFFLLPLRHSSGSRAGRMKWCRIGVALTAAYIAFAAAMHHAAFQHVSQFAGEARLDVQNIAALPLPPSPARWAGLIETPDRIYRIQFNELSDEPFHIQIFPQAAPNPYIAAARELSDVQIFLRFARFPLFQFSERDGKHVVDISDVRFYGDRRPAAPLDENGAQTNFTFEVVFAPDGKVLSQGRLREPR